jgi:hypothetical protein
MDQRSDREELLDRLLSAIGVGNAGGAECTELGLQLEFIKGGWEVDRSRRDGEVGRKPLLRKTLAAVNKLIELRRQLGPEGMRDIAVAAYGRINALHAYKAAKAGKPPPMEFPPVPYEEVDNLLIIEAHTIAVLLDRLSRDYRKTRLRAVVIEPFLTLLEIYGLWDRLAHSMIDIVEMLCDWVGVERKYRCTATGLRTIVSEFKAKGWCNNSDCDIVKDFIRRRATRSE